MDNALGAWIVTAVVFAGAALLVLLVKHWTGASVAEILFRWDPREARPSQSRAPRPTELNELERINEDFGESLDTESAKNALEHLKASMHERYILAAVAQYNLAAMYAKSAKTFERVRKMFDEEDPANRSRSVIGKDARIGANANNFYNATGSKNLKPHGARAYSRTERSTIGRLVERRSDRPRARERRLALH
jgi:hypothetical protein